jgi:hypothetical protein
VQQQRAKTPPRNQLQDLIAEKSRYKAAQAAPANSSTAVVPAGSTAVALPDTRTAHQQYLDEVAPSTIVGRMARFSKDGKFVLPDTDEEISADDDYVAMCDEVLIGWVKFNEEGTPPDRIAGLLYDGWIMPPRESLGDNDRAQWPLGLSGQPEDPWLHQMMLVLQKPATQELFTFVTTSKTGRRAVGNLLRHYDRLMKSHPDTYPVVRLKVGGFNHRDERIGWVSTPTFAVVGRAPKASATIPDTSTRADFDDRIPF